MNKDLQYFINITKECVKENGKPVSDEAVKYYADILKAGYDIAKNENKINKKYKRFIKFLSYLIDYVMYVIIAFIFTCIMHFVGAPDWGAVLSGVVITNIFIVEKEHINVNSGN